MGLLLCRLPACLLLSLQRACGIDTVLPRPGHGGRVDGGVEDGAALRCARGEDGLRLQVFDAVVALCQLCKKVEDSAHANRQQHDGNAKEPAHETVLACHLLLQEDELVARIIGLPFGFGHGVAHFGCRVGGWNMGRSCL